jgi:phosphoadenosine phosphosulfate reductase
MSVIMEQAAAQPSYTHEKIDPNDIESGYASGQSDYSPSPRTEKPVISLSKSHIEYLNEQMESMHPMDILRFCRIMFPNLYQSTAFGLTGLATMDMLSKIQKENPESRTVDLIFLDTLYHFKETYDLVDRVRERYPNVPIHIFKPDGMESAEQLEETYGEKFYHNAGDMYDFIVKVEPLQRAYDELKVAAVLNGRRRSQGAARGSIPIIEIDEERNIVKINPMATWSFAQVNQYIKENNVPTMPCLTKATSPSVTGTQPSPLARERMSAPVDGRARTKPSAASTTRSPSTLRLPLRWRARLPLPHET